MATKLTKHKQTNNKPTHFIETIWTQSNCRSRRIRSLQTKSHKILNSKWTDPKFTILWTKLFTEKSRKGKKYERKQGPTGTRTHTFGCKGNHVNFWPSQRRLEIVKNQKQS